MSETVRGIVDATMDYLIIVGLIAAGVFIGMYSFMWYTVLFLGARS